MTVPFSPARSAHPLIAARTDRARGLRRRLAAASGAGALALVLTACGSTAGSSADDADGDGAAASGAFPVTVEHIYGETEIPAAPERVIALGVTDADTLLALDVVPVATAGYTFFETGLGPWTEEHLGGQQPALLTEDADPDLEEIASLDPDLIVAVSSGIEEDVYQELSKIAPVVARPEGTAAYAVDREDQVEAIGDALDQAERAAELNQDVDDLLARTREENPEFAGKTGTVVLPYDGKLGVYLSGDARGQFLDSLGFELPQAIAAQDTGESFFVDVSPEQVEQIDGDLILSLTEDESGDLAAGSGQYTTLEAAQNDAIVLADTDQRGAITYNSVLSIPYAIDGLVPQIKEALAG